MTDGLDPSFLADRVDRVWPSVEALARELVLPDRWFYLVPLALAVAAICLGLGVLRRVAAFYAVTASRCSRSSRGPTGSAPARSTGSLGRPCLELPPRSCSWAWPPCSS